MNCSQEPTVRTEPEPAQSIALGKPPAPSPPRKPRRIKLPRLTQRNQDRVIGGCAVFLITVACMYSVQVKTLFDRFAAGSQVFYQFISHPWTQMFFFPLALIAVPLAIALLVSVRWFYWPAVAWMGIYGLAMLGGFVQEVYLLSHPFKPQFIHHNAFFWFFSTWGWLVIPHFIALLPPITLFYLLLPCRPGPADPATKTRLAGAAEAKP